MYELSKDQVKSWIAKSLEQGHSKIVLDIGRVRKYIRKATMPLIREQLLSELLPYDEIWKFGCLQDKKRSRCKLHAECYLQFNHCSRLVKFLFSSDMEKLHLNMRKIGAMNLEDTFKTLTRIVKMSEYCRLKELLMPGGSMQVEMYLPIIEDLCYYLSTRAEKLAKLHLPSGSNACLHFCAKMPSLQYLAIDRTKHLNYLGLQHLCHPKAITRYNLRAFHLGKMFVYLESLKTEICHALKILKKKSHS